MKLAVHRNPPRCQDQRDTCSPHLGPIQGTQPILFVYKALRGTGETEKELDKIEREVAS